MKFSQLSLIICGLLVCSLRPCAAETDPVAIRQALVVQHARIIYASYEDCVTEAKKLQAAVREFLAKPDAAGMEKARQAWIKARQPYLQTEAYRFYAGPIDDADGPEQLINAWPLDESYIEAPAGSPDPGIVGNIRAWPQISPELILKLNLADGEKNIACGWHAVEFLLWGPDTSATGPGNRPWTDYSIDRLAKRRGLYLQSCADLIVTQLDELSKEWAPDELGNYRAVFEEGIDYSVERIVSALIFLSENELAGERLQVAWDTKDQENEHSCFSDTTWQDNVWDLTGIQNVWRGVYVRTDGTKLEGTGLRDLCRVIQPDMEPPLTALIDGSLEKAKAIPQPFDQAILGDDTAPGRVAVMALIGSLEETGAALRKLARALSIEVPEVPPEDIEG